MCPFCSVFLPVLMTVQRSLSEDPGQTKFDGRWMTRSSLDTEFPYAVLIKMSRADDETCSGSLIDLDWVLTAARCMYKDGSIVESHNSLVIYAGVDERANDTVHVQNRTSKRILYHHIPDRDTFFSLALVQTDRPFAANRAGKAIDVLHLELDSTFDPKERGELFCRSGSYGRVEWDEARPLTLKKTSELIEYCSCSRSLRRAFPNVSTDQWMCGDYKYDMGVCKGDFGASLKCDQTFIGVAVDVVTFRAGTCEVAAGGSVSRECTRASSVAVYTDVCFHLEWIHSHVQMVPPNQTSCDDPDSAVTARSDLPLLCSASLFLFWLLWG